MSAFIRSPSNLIAFALLSLAAVAGAGQPNPEAPPSMRPNYLFVVFEDLSPRIGAYGDEVADTPVLDALARESTVYLNAFTTAGVCAPSRAALMLGMAQETVGAQHMRTTQGALRPDGSRLPYVAVPPPEVKAFPELLRAAGYYTTNNLKTDYQLGFGFHEGPFTIWDEHRAEHAWRGRAEGQPFFAMVNLMQTHESYLFDPREIRPDDHPFAPAAINFVTAWQKTAPDRTDPATVEVPPFLPDTPKVRRDIARQYDNLHFAERELARLLAELEQDGLADNTVVVVTSDHGDGLPRAKRSLYDSGLRVPLMVRLPEAGEGVGRSDELVSFLDLAPTFLSLAQVPVPEWMQGRVFLGDELGPERGFVYAHLGRHDTIPDRQRAVRDQRWKYIRNELPEEPFFRHLRYRDLLGTMRELWRLHESRELSPTVAQYFEAPRPAEELYDTWSDPFELHNLAQAPEAARELDRLRRALDRRFARSAERLTEVHDAAGQISELAMVQRMWPGLEQPKTAMPRLSVRNETVALVSDTRGASIGYRIGGGPWRLYVGPLRVPSGVELEAKAIRYGFEESDVMKVTR